jgi:hypothetical protein
MGFPSRFSSASACSTCRFDPGYSTVAAARTPAHRRPVLYVRSVAEHGQRTSGTPHPVMLNAMHAPGTPPPVCTGSTSSTSCSRSLLQILAIVDRWCTPVHQYFRGRTAEETCTLRQGCAIRRVGARWSWSATIPDDLRGSRDPILSASSERAARQALRSIRPRVLGDLGLCTRVIGGKKRSTLRTGVGTGTRTPGTRRTGAPRPGTIRCA